MANDQQPDAHELAILNALGALQDQAHATGRALDALTDFILKVSAQASSVTAVAEVVDDNEANAQSDRQTAQTKELVTHLFRESHAYIVVVIAAGYAGFFTLFNAVSSRYPSSELYLASTLMLFSLTVFVVWEVISMSYVGFLMMSQRLGQINSIPRWYRLGWPVALFLSLGSALPAAVIAGAQFLTGLQQSQQQAHKKPFQVLQEQPGKVNTPKIVSNPPSSPQPPSPGARADP